MTRFHTRMMIVLLALLSSFVSPSHAQQVAGKKRGPAGTTTISGLVVPGSEKKLALRTRAAQFEFEWNARTRVALKINTRLLRRLKGGKLSFNVHSSTQVLTYQIPKGPITGIVALRGRRQVDKALATARQEQWIPERGLRLEFGQSVVEGQLPTSDDPRFIGTWNPATTPRTLTIGSTAYEISLKRGGQTTALLYGLITAADCRPFVNRATVTGSRRGDVIVADEIHVEPLGDQAALDDPNLPRYLFIGDSISGNYSRGLRDALKGKFNLHHPPTNCGPSGKGKGNIVEWLGGYKQSRRGWDVISFNFGHWDAGNDRKTYQANIEAVITELKKTHAKLIWVTTCPVPAGFPPAGDLTSRGKAPRRTAGVMRKYLNPWALEVIARHPEITVCDQWRFVKHHQDDLFLAWWKGKNVHFRGEPATALGRLLADHVLRVTSR